MGFEWDACGLGPDGSLSRGCLRSTTGDRRSSEKKSECQRVSDAHQSMRAREEAAGREEGRLTEEGR